jgi:hypothetical protein
METDQLAVRHFRKKAKKSQPPTGAQRSGGTCSLTELSWKYFSSEATRIDRVLFEPCY